MAWFLIGFCCGFFVGGSAAALLSFKSAFRHSLFSPSSD